MRRFLIVFLLAALAALPLPARSDSSGDAFDASDAEAFVDRYLKTFNAADSVALAGLYASDGLILPPSGAPVRGREAIQKFWSVSSRQSLSFSILQKNVCGDSGFFAGNYRARENRNGRVYPAPFARLSSDRTLAPMSGNFTLCLRRDANGNWKVASDMWTEILWGGFVPLGQEGGSIVPAHQPDR